MLRCNACDMLTHLQFVKPVGVMVCTNLSYRVMVP
jgi:hypothetical protein